MSHYLASEVTCCHFAAFFWLDGSAVFIVGCFNARSWVTGNKNHLGPTWRQRYTDEQSSYSPYPQGLYCIEGKIDSKSIITVSNYFLLTFKYVSNNFLLTTVVLCHDGRVLGLINVFNKWNMIWSVGWREVSLEKRHTEKELARYLLIAAEETACAKVLRQKYAQLS